VRKIKILWCAVAVGAAVAAITAGLTSASAAGPARHHTLSHTARIVARPVTYGGQVVPGYTVSNGSGSIDCTDGTASPAAVARNILFCSPDSEYAIACYPWTPHPHYALCLRNARTRTLASIRHTGAMPPTSPPTHPTPLDLTLANGTKCSLRAGGTSAILHQHPSWNVYYYCNDGNAVWGPHPYGVNTSHAVWTVRTANSDGTGDVRTRNVAKAWFVGRHT
jgi:hypothetical protein